MLITQILLELTFFNIVSIKTETEFLFQKKRNLGLLISKL